MGKKKYSMNDYPVQSKIAEPLAKVSMGKINRAYKPKPSVSKPMKKGDRPQFPEWDTTLMAQAKLIATNRGYLNNPQYNSYLYKKMLYNQNRATYRTISGSRTALNSFYENMGRVFSEKTFRRIYALGDDAKMMEKRLPHKMRKGDFVVHSELGEIGVLQDNAEIRGDKTVLKFGNKNIVVDSFDHAWSVVVQDDSMATTTSNNPVAASSAQSAATLFKDEETKKKKKGDKDVNEYADAYDSDVVEVSDSNYPNIPQTGALFNKNKREATGLMHTFPGGHQNFHSTMNSIVKQFNIPPGSRIKVSNGKNLFHGKVGDYTQIKKNNVPFVKAVSGKHPIGHYENFFKGSSTQMREVNLPHGKFNISWVPKGETPKEKASAVAVGKNIPKVKTRDLHTDIMSHWEGVKEKYEKHLQAHPNMKPENVSNYLTKINNFEAFKEHINKYPVRQATTTMTKGNSEFKTSEEKHLGYINKLRENSPYDTGKMKNVVSPGKFKSAEEKKKYFEGMKPAGTGRKDSGFRQFISSISKSAKIQNPDTGTFERGLDFEKHFDVLKKSNANVEIYLQHKDKRKSTIPVAAGSIHDFPHLYMSAKDYAKQKRMSFSPTYIVKGNFSNIAKGTDKSGAEDYKKIVGKSMDVQRTKDKMFGNKPPAQSLSFKKIGQKRTVITNRRVGVGNQGMGSSLRTQVVGGAIPGSKDVAQSVREGRSYGRGIDVGQALEEYNRKRRTIYKEDKSIGVKKKKRLPPEFDNLSMAKK